MIFWKKKTSFKDGLDKTQLPIISAEIDGKTLNFVLDSGSSYSYINASDMEDLYIANSDTATQVISGLDNIKHEIFFANFEITIKDYTCVHMFGAYDLEDTFKLFKETNGIEVHGILGSDFFNMHNYVLDYKNFKFYRK